MEKFTDAEMDLLYNLLRDGKAGNVHTARLQVSVYDKVETELIARGLIKKEVQK